MHFHFVCDFESLYNLLFGKDFCSGLMEYTAYFSSPLKDIIKLYTSGLFKFSLCLSYPVGKGANNQMN